jgi:hypothetical protein
VFRPVPDRWIVVRHVENGRFSRQTLASGQLKRDSIGIRDVKPDPGYIPLTVVTTVHPFFADYQQHNTGVFSF